MLSIGPYTSIVGHALNLGVSDCVKQSKVMKSAFGTVAEISKLIKSFPKWDSSFERLKIDQAPETPGFRVLCLHTGQCVRHLLRA